jgi:hypothetical protein
MLSYLPSRIDIASEASSHGFFSGRSWDVTPMSVSTSSWLNSAWTSGCAKGAELKNVSRTGVCSDVFGRMKLPRVASPKLFSPIS